MIFLVSRSSSIAGSILELVVLLIIFVLILFAAYYVSKWIGKKGMPGSRKGNIELIEAFRLNQTKQILIIRAGVKYLLVGITKDNMEFLCEMKEDELDFTKPDAEAGNDLTFRDVMKQVLKKEKGKTEKK